MLVLSRKVGQEIRLVEAGVTIRLADSRSGKAQIAIDAPREITVLRGELDEQRRDDVVVRSIQSAVSRLADWAESVEPEKLAGDIKSIDGLIERLLELRAVAGRQASTSADGCARLAVDRKAMAFGGEKQHVRQSGAAYAIGPSSSACPTDVATSV